MADPLALLSRHGLRKTAMRQQVLGVFALHSEAIGQQQLEDRIGAVDRITLYRTLRSFEEAGIIHRAIDGGPVAKWALCHDQCTDHGHNDRHAHFHCTACQRTVCINQLAMPVLKAPSGYQLTDTQVIMSGLCPDCQ